jgi:hypothetical protein
MQFADPRQRANAYLILRHLYDGDVIEWPIDDGHPLKPIFDALEMQGYVARWDRVWPLHDRYRLTEAGIAAIEAVYRPADSATVWNELRGRNMTVVERRTYLIHYGYDPYLWPLLHDPSVGWDTYYDDPGIYWGYVWEDELPYRSRHVVETGPVVDEVVVADDGPVVYDLDREASMSPDVAIASPHTSADYDVS